ncbi:hypothetical protein Lal_00035498 [Lupinus albus]|nr:hypothetical protein Lal_00035498 [Lupinus albus]
MTRGNTGHLHPINPEIDRTYHRLVKQSRNLPFHSVPDSVSDSDSISDSIPISMHFVEYIDFVHFVALSDSEHSENSVHSENMAQPPTPPGPLMFVLLCLSQELLIILRLMLQTSTTTDQINNNKIMIHLKADTTLVGEIIQISSGLITHNNDLLMHHFRTTMLDIIDLMFPHQFNNKVINNPPPVPSEPSLEELVRQMTMQNMQLQQETKASI